MLLAVDAQVAACHCFHPLQLIEPYLTLPIASNYTAALSKYSGGC